MNSGTETSPETRRRNRRSLRLQGYDYSQAGAYFVTICTQNRECLFGDVVEGRMVLSDAGRLVEEEWKASAVIRREIELDLYVVMPNHFHGIVFIIPDDCRGDRPVAPTAGVANRWLQISGHQEN